MENNELNADLRILVSALALLMPACFSTGKKVSEFQSMSNAMGASFVTAGLDNLVECNQLVGRSNKESGPYWRSNTQALIVDDAITSDGALRFSAGTVTKNVTAIENTRYVISGYGKTKQGDTKSGAGIDFKDESGQKTGRSELDIELTPQYSPFKLELVAPPGTTQMTLWVVAGESSQIYLDELDLRRQDCQSSVQHTYELIASNLVDALAQINGYDPTDTVIHVSSPVDAFSQALKIALERGGYAIRTVKNPTSGPLLNSKIERVELDEPGEHFTFYISLGEIKLKRNFSVSLDKVKPSSNLFAQGLDASGIQLNDDMFY